MMIKKRYILPILSLILLMSACGRTDDIAEESPVVSTTDSGIAEQSVKDEDPAKNDAFRIGIVTGSYAQSEDDRRGAEAFREMYGDDKVTLAIYPDNFSEDIDTTVNIIEDMADDPKIKAIIVNQAVDGTAEAFRQIHEIRPDIICIAGEAYEDFSEIGEVADLVVNSDFVARGYLMIRSAHELGCDTFVHISFFCQFTH